MEYMGSLPKAIVYLLKGDYIGLGVQVESYMYGC